MRQWWAVAFLLACSSGSETDDEASRKQAQAGDPKLAFLVDAEPVTSVEDALDGVFIPPYESCREPLDGRPGQGPNGQVCTAVAISGATEEGRRFADYADCEVVRTQRPFWVAPPAAEPDPEDPRLQDSAYAAELDWVTEQLSASGCVCCHDSSAPDGSFAQWDISARGVWLDTLSDTGLSLFAGLADSSVLGAYAPEDNNGFARELTGVPSTDPQRMQAFMLAELEQRGISRAQAEQVPPFGGPIYTNSIKKPGACEPGEGVTSTGEIRWRGPRARYIHVLEEGSANPGVPPNRDLPEGTLWRLDVPANQPAIASGVQYGTTPDGTLQAVPERSQAPALKRGERYHLFVQLDVGVPLASCVFTFGEDDTTASTQDPTTDTAGDSNDITGLGEPCTGADQCTLGADYCALMPGQSEGYCTPTGCVEQPTLCPEGWSCFDVSVFAPGQPSICIRQ